MATKRPLVVYSGSLQELAAGDRLDIDTFDGPSLTLQNSGSADLKVTGSGTTPGQITSVTANRAGTNTDTGFRWQSAGATRWVGLLGGGDTDSKLAWSYYDGSNVQTLLSMWDRTTGQSRWYGQMNIKPLSGGATLSLDKAAAGQIAAVRGRTNGVARWEIQLGDSNTESGSNAGSHFRIHRYSDAGAALDGAGGVFAIDRAAGVTFVNHLSSAGNVSASSGTVAAINGNFTGVVQTNGSSGYGFSTTAYATVSGPTYVTYSLFSSPGFDLALQGIHIPGNWAGWRMAIGATSPALIDFRNNGHIYSSNGWSSVSDARVKRNIKPLRAWERFKRIKWFSYFRTDQPGGMQGPVQPTEELGVIGQQLEKLEPQMVSRDWLTEEFPDHLSVKYPQVYNLGMATLAEAMQRIEALEARLAAVEGGLE